MNGPIKMYRMNPIVVHDFSVQLPKCMYRMNNIHSPRNNPDGTQDHVSLPDKKLDIFDQNCQEIPGMAELEAKQNEILEQLAQLKKQIHSIKCDLNLQNGSTSTVILSAKKCSIKKPIVNELPETVVITASPTSPPYSLEIIQHLLRNEIGLIIKSFLHSTVVSLPDSTQKLKESLESFKPQPGVRKLIIHLIWKNVPSNVEFLLSYTPISDEVNFLRFLSRSASSVLNYDNEANYLEIESLLDQCYLLVRAKTKTERVGIFQTLSKSVSKSLWLAGRNQPGVLDVAAYSAIKQCSASKDLSANLGKWFERCQTLVSA